MSATPSRPDELSLAGQVGRIPGLLAVHSFNLPGDVPPWTDTGIDLETGQWISVLGSGRVFWMSRDEEQWADAKHHLWGRIGLAGPIFNPTQQTTSVPVEGAGRLFLCLLHGFWANERGVLASSPKAYQGLRGAIDATVLVWEGPPGAGLDALAGATDSEAVRAEARRFADPVPTPRGWEYLFETGFADVFREVPTDHGPGIQIHTDNAQGIIRKPLAFPMNRDTELSWRWKLDRFASSRPEDTVRTHDYLSLACEFENGRDLTWFWSCALPTETHFGCPVRSWNFREVHYCVRSGSEGLGEWQEERRNVFEDCQTALGENPGDIHHFWFIAVSSFQHGEGLGTFADVWLHSGGQSLQVL